MLYVYPKNGALSSYPAACRFFCLIVFVLFLSLGRTQAQAPVLTQFIPDSAALGDTVLLRGSHLHGVSLVSFGGVAATSFHAISDSAIWAVVGHGASGFVRVSDSLGTDSLGGFVFIAPAQPAPHLISFTPHAAAEWDTVRLTGTHLSGVISVTFGGVPAHSFTIISDSSIRAIVGAGATGKVKVFTSHSSDSLNGFIFILASSPVPHILSFSPDSARQGDTISIHGIHFTGTTLVSFGGVAAGGFSVITDSLIRAVVGPGASGNVRVTNTLGTDSLGGFRFIPSPAPPSIHSFAPLSGTTGTVVTITGTHFTGTTQVLFGGVATLSFFVPNDTLIQAVVGSGATGAVKVVTPGGLAVAGATFTFIPPSAPDILSFFPDSARTNDTVRIVGIHLDSVNVVRFGGIPAKWFTIISDSLIWAVVDTGASGQIWVGANFGQDSLGGFVYLSAPAPVAAPAASALNIYPNPTRYYIVAFVPVTTGPSKFTLAETSGRVVLTVPVSRGVQQVNIPVGRFNRGVYKLVWSNGSSLRSATVLLIN